MFIATLVWSNGVWGEEEITSKNVTFKTEAELSALVSDNGYTVNNVTFKLNESTYESGTYSEWFKTYSYYCINIGSIGKGSFTRNITLTPPSGYLVSSVDKVTVRAVGYASSGANERYMQIEGGSKTNVRSTFGVTNPQRKDEYYHDVSSSAALNPIVITCFGETNVTHPFHINNIYIEYKLSRYRYHAQSTAIAVPIAGGTAYTSFASSSPNSNSVTTNSGWITASSATTDVYYKATANTGYVFKGWTEATETSFGGNLTNNSYSTSLTYNGESSSNPTLISYKAWFAPHVKFTVSAGVGIVNGGTASTNWTQSTQTLEGTPGTTTVATSVTYSATVSNEKNYKFCGWAESQTETDKTKITGNASNTVELSGNAGAEVNKTLYAIYAPIHHFTAQAEVGEHGGGDATVEYEATVEGEPNVLTGSTKATFKADADQGYVFVGWAESKSASTAEQCISPLTEFEYEITTANPSKTLYAIFAPVFNFDATATKNRDGGTVTAMVDDSSITGEPGASSASTSATFSVTSTKSGYVFKGWKENATDTEYKSTSTTYTTSGNDDVLNNEPGTTVTKTMVAIFAPLYKFSATAVVGSVNGGTVSVSGYSTQVEGAPDANKGTTTATFTATATSDYKFVGWSESEDGDIVSTENPYYPNLTNDKPGTTERLALYAIFKLSRIHLYSDTEPDYQAGEYDEVQLHRTFNKGYSTIALPFQTTLYELTGQRSAEDWVAQLSVVTYTAADKNEEDKGYTLYFKKTGHGADADGGIIEANKPYVLHLSKVVENPVWTNLQVKSPSSSSVVQADKGYADNGYGDYSDWRMHANYEPGESMVGKYGIVNNSHLAGDPDPEHPDESEKTRFPEGCLKLGGTGSTLNAFMAYIEGPTSAPVKAAYLDDDDNADGLLEALRGEEVSGTESVYDLQGRKLPKAQRGLNIIRGADGVVRKVMNN